MQKHANSAKAERRGNRSFSYRAPGHSNTIEHDSTSKPRHSSAARRPPMPTSQSGPNYGERLYNRGVKKREELEMRIRNARSEQLRREIEGITFEPHTNAQAYKREQKTEDLLINYGRRKEEILNFQRALKQHEELSQCKFKPEISKKSEVLVRNRSQMLEQASGRSDGSKKASQKFESLYQDAMRRNER
jgi:hypothetical protein